MNINERAIKYAKEINYYKISKIKRYLRLYDKVIEKLRYDLKPSICPECGSSNTSIKHLYKENSCDVYVMCEECWCLYDDKEYIDKTTNFKDYNYFDEIGMKVWADGIGKGYIWFKFCDKEIDKMIKNLSS